MFLNEIFVYFSVKTEIKTEPDVKKEKTASNECVEYPENIDELFTRHEPQLVLLQVGDEIFFFLSKYLEIGEI